MISKIIVNMFERSSEMVLSDVPKDANVPSCLWPKVFKRVFEHMKKLSRTDELFVSKLSKRQEKVPAIHMYTCGLIIVALIPCRLGAL